MREGAPELGPITTSCQARHLQAADTLFSHLLWPGCMGHEVAETPARLYDCTGQCLVYALTPRPRPATQDLNPPLSLLPRPCGRTSAPAALSRDRSINDAILAMIQLLGTIRIIPILRNTQSEYVPPSAEPWHAMTSCSPEANVAAGVPCSLV